MTLPPCPQCSSAYTYEDRDFLVCPECGHEWSPDEAAAAEEEGGLVIHDANGTRLADDWILDDPADSFLGTS